MMATATHNAHGPTPERGLFLAFALRETTWTLGVTTGPGHPPRERPVAARHPARWLQAIAQAKRRFENALYRLRCHVGASLSAPLACLT